MTKYPGWRTMNAAQRHNARHDRIWAENFPRAYPYVTGDGIRFRTEAEAITHANQIAATTGVIVSVERR
jgi:hypothetical protein